MIDRCVRTCVSPYCKMAHTSRNRISQWRRLRNSNNDRTSDGARKAKATIVFSHSVFVAIATSCLLLCCVFDSLPIVDASSAAGTETLVGIVGRDFVLLGADSSVSQSIALTASNLDKIAHLVDPFPGFSKETTTTSSDSDRNGNGVDADGGVEEISLEERLKIQLQKQWEGRQRQQTILAAAAGDAADSDRLLGYLKAIGTLEEYKKNNGQGCDVVRVSLDSDYHDHDDDGSQSVGELFTSGGLDAKAMAHLARRCIWEKLRSRTPYRICLLVAGMVFDEESYNARFNKEEHAGAGSSNQQTDKPAFLSQKVQNQVKQALSGIDDIEKSATITTTNTVHEPQPQYSFSSRSAHYKPSLFWLDEYGSLQSIEYGAHGHGSNFLLSILDQNYKPDLTRDEALGLMKECFQELRNRYVINSPEAPCIKCVDANGVRLM